MIIFNLSSEALKEAASCLKVLSHPTRLQIVQLLCKKKRTVGEISEECEIPHNLASTHLKTLERCRLLKSNRKGKHVEYQVIEKHLYDLMRCISKGFSS
jgi:ArsR family transcriptional regulator, zinc-responsive transcriptional repressor